jgi:hypothetical protein
VDASWRLAVAAIFVWLGMMLAISFFETPLKFRAPGINLPLGLGIGRLVFRALNVCEMVLAFVIALALFTHETTARLDLALTVAIGTLFLQTVLVRPLLSHRTESVLAGEESPRPGAHLSYVALEAIKVIALVTAGVLMLNA